jgi:hypothetical protein
MFRTALVPLEGLPFAASEPGKSEEVPLSSRKEGRSGLTKAAAEELLDLLEAQGYRGGELAYAEGEGFAVRWRQDDALPARASRYDTMAV